MGAHLNILVGGPFKLVGKNQIEGARAPWINIIVGAHLNWEHLNIIVRGPFKLVGKNQIEGARAPWINIIVRGPFKLGPFKWPPGSILLFGAHLC